MVAFVLTLALAGPTAQPFLKTPDIHGDKVVFSCEGDVWLGDLGTGQAVRMTRDEGLEDAPCFSPDGTMVAFHGEYDGIRGAYVMPTEGGAPKRVSMATDFRSVTGWSPDGQYVVFRKTGVPTNYEYWLAPVSQGAFKKLPLEFVSHIWFGKDTDHFVFTRFNRWYAAWFRYIGGMQNQVWEYDGKKFWKLTDLAGTNEFPVWCGDNVYFANEKDAQWSLMTVPASGGKPRTVAGPYDVEIRELSTDGHRVVYEKGNSAELYDPSTGKTQKLAFTMETDLQHTRPFHITAETYAGGSSLSPNAKRVFAEARGQIVTLPVGEGEARPWKAKPGARLQHPVMSKDAKTVAYISDESGEMQVHLCKPDGTGDRQLTHLAPCQVKWVEWLPDSQSLVCYTSEMKLRLIDATTGADKEIAHFSGLLFGPQVSFSPDSNWIAFSRNKLNTDVDQLELYNVKTGELKTVSDGSTDDRSPAFSTDGKYLAFLSRRNFSAGNDPILNQLNFGPSQIACVLPLQADTDDPFKIKDPDEEAEAKPAEKKDEKPAEKKEDKPASTPTTKIDFDGLFERRIEVPIAPGSYNQIEMVKDRILLGTGGSIVYYDFSAKKSGSLTSGGPFQLSKDGSKLLIGQGANLRVVDTAGSDIPATAGAVSWGGVTLTIDPVQEWKEIYWDAWRLLRDYFYVANMHGLDWRAIGDKYAAMLPSVRSRNELDDLLRWMQGEIGSSHEYISPGDTRDNKRRAGPAFLGIDLEDGPNGTLRIAKVVRGDGFRTGERSPLADPSLKVKEGMYLLKVAGEPVKSQVEVSDILIGRAGRVVGVTVNDKPTLEGARTVYVKPVASEGRMRYLDWVAANRRYVDKASGGKVGYLHMAAMEEQDMQDFAKQYFPQRDKEALIVDDRFNNGGYVQTMINNVLGARVTGYFNMRESREPWSRQGDAFIGPRCCLINEFCISCGEEFPHRFKDQGIGKLIGRRTMGGEVGSSPGWPLVDGGVINVPNYGMFTMKDGWVIEGEGVTPDIDVPSDPNAFVAGHDAQLDAAVKEMLEELKRNPVKWPAQPKDRVRVPGRK